MTYFPFYQNIENQHGLIVGGGKVACRKAIKLLSYGVNLTMIAPNFSDECRSIACENKNQLVLEERAFKDTDILSHANVKEGLQFVIAATDDAALNRKIYELCTSHHILVNVVDKPELCTFLFPALIHKGDLSVGISTQGASPTAAAWLRQQIEQILPEDFEDILAQLKEERAQVARDTAKGVSERSKYFKNQFYARLYRKTEDDIGFVSLVGAGCGQKEWITLEGLQELQRCDAVVYDDLIDKRLLDCVPESAKRIYVGKRNGRNYTKQEEIQSILIQLASERKRVVRLKGGDPFVFGRGGEEAAALNRANIPWKSVPGISSAIAILAEAGIPVTHRGVSRSFHVMTAHTKEDALRKDMEQFAHLEGTLVILMGIQSLSVIVSSLLREGRHPKTPIAILSGGNSSKPYKLTGTLDTIIAQAAIAKPTTPGIIVIGDVVAFDMKTYGEDGIGSCHRVHVGLTGTDDFQAKIRKRLLPYQYKITSLMKGSYEKLDCTIPYGELGSDVSKWIVFTSAEGVRTFFEDCEMHKIDRRQFYHCKFAVIGAITEKQLNHYGIYADVCPTEYNSYALAKELIQAHGANEGIYLFVSRQGTDILEKALLKENIHIKRYCIYDTVFHDFKNVKDMEDKIAYLLFGSAGGVKAVYDAGMDIDEDTKILCIGPIVADAVRKYYHRSPEIADFATVDSLVNLLENNI